MRIRRVFCLSRVLGVFVFAITFLVMSHPSSSGQIDRSQRVREMEPNNTLNQAQNVAIPSDVFGDLVGTEDGQFELFGTATTADMFLVAITEPTTIVLKLEFGEEAGFGLPPLLCGGEPFTCVCSNPDLFLLGFNPFRLIDFSARGFINFGDTFFPGDPFGPESIPSSAPDLFGFSPGQPVPPGQYLIAISDQGRALLSLLTNGSFVELLNPGDTTDYRLQVSAVGADGQTRTVPAADESQGMFRPDQGEGVSFGTVTLSDVQAVEKAIGASVNPRDVREIKVSRALTLQFDYYENTAQAEAFHLLRQQGNGAALVASGTRVSDPYFKIEPMALEPGTYFLVALTGENVIYTLSVTDGVNPEPILSAFQFPEINLSEQAVRLLTGTAPR